METDQLRQLVAGALTRALDSEGGLLLLAVSGGADSMALWDLLAGLPQWKLAIYHLDHQLRVDAPEDSELIRRYAATAADAGRPATPIVCERHAITDYVRRWRCSIEMAGRRLRYERLREVAHRLEARAVLTAHHRDDQAESVLGNLLRGAGPMGRAGIAAKRQLSPTVAIVRPLLGVARAELREHCRRHSVPWREDSTNRDLGYRRNFLRLRVLPAFEAGVPGFTSALVAVSEREQAALALSQPLAERAWHAGLGERELSLAAIPCDPDLRWQVWVRLLAVLGSAPQRRQLAALDHLADAKIGFQLTIGRWLVTRRRLVIAWQEQHPHASSVALQLAGPGWHRRGEDSIDCSITTAPLRLDLGPRTALLDARALTWPLHWRQAHRHERWQPLGCPGHQTVVKYLAARGVASRLRCLTPVVADQQGILWIPGHGIADRAQVRPESAAVVRLEWLPACQQAQDARVTHAPGEEQAHGHS